MKNWNKPQLSELSTGMTEFKWQGKGADCIWNEAQNVPEEIPDGVFGS